MGFASYFEDIIEFEGFEFTPIRGPAGSSPRTLSQNSESTRIIIWEAETPQPELRSSLLDLYCDLEYDSRELNHLVKSNQQRWIDAARQFDLLHSELTQPGFAGIDLHNTLKFYDDLANRVHETANRIRAIVYEMQLVVLGLQRRMEKIERKSVEKNSPPPTDEQRRIQEHVTWLLHEWKSRMEEFASIESFELRILEQIHDHSLDAAMKHIMRGPTESQRKE